MSGLYEALVRPVLFQQDSEAVHDFTLRLLGRVSRQPVLCDALAAFLRPEALPVDLFGLRFPNPVGLAAGMDKRAAAVPVWAALGFGFSELGGVTRHAQEGNPRPRMFRAVSDRALINRMGFNNPGAEALADALRAWREAGLWPDHPVGINLGKSKITPLNEAADDYACSFNALWALADFFVVNVSSPNTPNLRQLQDRAALDEILAALAEVNRHQSRATGRAPKPVLVKVAPDLSFTALDEILGLVGPRAVAGIVATNTTITRPESPAPELGGVYRETGGLSGRPLAARSTEIIRHLYRQTKGAVPIIGVGGIFSAGDAWEKITAGASLVQVYTGLVYAGPGITRAIVEGLRGKLSALGLSRLGDAVGIG